MLTNSQELEGRGSVHKFGQKVVFKLYNWIFNDFWVVLMGFWPFFKDLEPKLRLYLGEKLGPNPKIKFYLNQSFLEVYNIIIIPICEVQDILCREARRVVELWRPFLRVLLHLFQCHLLRWVFEIENKIVMSFIKQIDVILIHWILIRNPPHWRHAQRCWQLSRTPLKFFGVMVCWS